MASFFGHHVFWSGSRDLADRDSGDHGVLAERAAAHEVKQRLSIARETARAIRHETLTLRDSVRYQITGGGSHKLIEQTVSNIGNDQNGAVTNSETI